MKWLICSDDLPEATQNTIVIAKRCSIFLVCRKTDLPPFQTESGRNEVGGNAGSFSEDGLDVEVGNFVLRGTKRGGKDRQYLRHRDRLDFRIGYYQRNGISGLLLIVSDFIIWAKRK